MSERENVKMLNDYYKLWKMGNRCYTRRLFLCCKALRIIVRLFFPSTDIPFDAKLGSNILFPHRAIGVIIHKDAIVGDNAKIQANVCIGGKYMKGVPTIGKNVLIGTGALILGGISVGDDVIVGAGAIVICDIPARKVVAGNPAHIIKDVSDDLIGIQKK